jgi:type II secretory pathway pseudopilin PulG
MKQKDILLIVVVAVISAIASYFLSNIFFASPKNRQQQVEVVQSISPEFTQPDERYFNKNAFDPTQPITIGNNANADPFKKN